MVLVHCHRYNDKRMLPYDRTVGNFMEWAVPFLCLFWIRWVENSCAGQCCASVQVQLTVLHAALKLEHALYCTSLLPWGYSAPWTMMPGCRTSLTQLHWRASLSSLNLCADPAWGDLGCTWLNV